MMITIFNRVLAGILPVMLFFWISTAYSQTYLTAEEIMTQIIGQKLGGTSSGGDAWHETYHHPKKEGQRKGRIEGVEGGRPSIGSWQVKDGDNGGVMCFFYSNYNWCGYLEITDGSTVNFYHTDGRPATGYPNTQILD